MAMQSMVCSKSTTGDGDAIDGLLTLDDRRTAMTGDGDAIDGLLRLDDRRWRCNRCVALRQRQAMAMQSMDCLHSKTGDGYTINGWLYSG